MEKVKVKIENLDEYIQLFYQLKSIIEKINNYELTVEISQSLNKD